MLIKIVTVIFYTAIALWAFDAGFPYLMPIIGICALILAIANAL